MRRRSGGSAANTIAAQAFGLTTTQANGDDENGRHFYSEMRNGHPHRKFLRWKGARSGQCLVLVTSDGQRTMCTDLGV